MRVALLFLVVASCAMGQGVTVAYSDGRPPLLLKSTDHGGVIYHRLDEVATGLNGLTSWTPGRRRAAIIADRDSITVTVDSRFFIANGHGICLDHPIIYAEGSVFVPEEFLMAIPPFLNSVRASWIDSLGQFLVEGAPCDLHLIRVAEDSSTVRLDMDLPSHAAWVLSPCRGDSITLTVRGATVCPSDFEGLCSEAAVASVSARQEPGRAVVVAHRANPGLGARCIAGGSSLTLVIGPQEPVEPATRPVRRIAVDAGHGGDDSGARSQTGTAEKDVTATAAALLATALRERLDEADVLLIRQDDGEIPGDLRVARANAADADAFISLHCDWSFDRSHRGATVSFSMPRQGRVTTDWVSMDGVVTTRESLGGASGPPPSAATSWDDAANAWVLASRDLAEAVTAAIVAMGIPAHDPVQRTLGMCRGLAMPGIVIELGNLSNPVEARDLATLEYLQSLTDAVADGIARYVESSRAQDES